MSRKIRAAIEFGIFFLGALIILSTKAVFDNAMRGKAALGAGLDLVKDDFYLFFVVSLVISGVLLVLTVLSALTYLFEKSVNRFQRIVVSVAPVICSVSVAAIALFYSYLTSGGFVSITGYILALGAGEAMIFRFACGIYVLLRQPENVKKTK